MAITILVIPTNIPNNVLPRMIEKTSEADCGRRPDWPGLGLDAVGRHVAFSVCCNIFSVTLAQCGRSEVARAGAVSLMRIGLDDVPKVVSGVHR